MSTQPVKRLSKLEIDEVSLVDRPANQHGLVTITKRDEGTAMGLFDAQGNEVDEDQLQSGDVVFDEHGEQIVMLSDDDIEALLESGELSEDDLNLEADDRELATVGKGLRESLAAVTGGASTKIQAGKKIASRNIDDVKLGFSHGKSGAPSSVRGSGGQNFGRHLGRNRNAYYAASAAGTEENVRGRFRKNAPSLGEEVLSELSKALTDGDQHQVISKVAQRVEQAEAIAKAAQDRADAIEEEREFERYTEIAKGFELPVDPEHLGEILMEVSKVLTDEQLDTLERVLYTAGAAIDFEERGSSGGSPIMAYVGEAATELVGKSAGDLSEAEATTALFSANDDAYLAYLSENQR